VVILTITADDLTGACNTAVQFARAGINTLVTTNIDIDPGDLDPAVSVLVVDTDSRHVSAATAAQRVGNVVMHSYNAGVSFHYKKTDSTLRGNVGAELTAMILALRSDRLFFLPAYPKAQRYTRNGIQYVGDCPVHQTQFGRDPRYPMTTSVISEIIAKQCTIPVTITNAKELDGILDSATEGICVCDASTDDDLSIIAKKLKTANAISCTAGPAGFAELLPDLLMIPRNNTRSLEKITPLVIVNGSLTDTALEQVKTALATGCVGVKITPEQLLATEAIISLPDHIADKDIILYTVLTHDDIKAYTDYGADLGITGVCFHERFACELAAITVSICNKMNRNTICAFGGETSRAVLDAVHSTGLYPIDAIQPGMAISAVAGKQFSGYLITKSGGCCTPDIVHITRTWLKRHSL
jgi:uncharacterized protein YgbK (DUF1537 family)